MVIKISSEFIDVAHLLFYRLFSMETTLKGFYRTETIGTISREYWFKTDEQKMDVTSWISDAFGCGLVCNADIKVL